MNSATLASGKCHYCKAKQVILMSYIGTIPVLKWLRSDTTVRLFFSFRRTTLKILFTLNAQWHMLLRVKVNSYFHKIFCVFLENTSDRFLYRCVINEALIRNLRSSEITDKLYSSSCINPILRLGLCFGSLDCSSARALLMASSCRRVLSLMSFWS